MKCFLNELIAQSAYDRLAEKMEIITDINRIEEFDAMIIRKQPVTGEMFEKARNLKTISRHGIGCDMIDMEAARQHNVTVSVIPGGNAESVAELAAAFMMSLSRNVKICDSGLREGKFDTFAPKSVTGFEMFGKTLAIIGTGHIALRLAEIMQSAFGMRVLGYSPHFTDEKAKEHNIERYVNFEEMLPLADYVSINVPLTDSTRNMIDWEQLCMMKPTAILVNTARGGIVNEDALYKALKEKVIFAAASDVFVEEPPKADNPLLGLDNFIATPHAGSSTYESMERCGNIAVDNVFKALGI